MVTEYVKWRDGVLSYSLENISSKNVCLMKTEIIVRDAEEADLPALTAIRPPEAIHRGRLRDAQHPDFRFLVFIVNEETIGFSCLVFRCPLSWSTADDKEHLPQIVDLHIAEAYRGRGYGSEAIHAMERRTVEAGYQQLYIAVEPLHNPRAYALYQRLGYQSLQSEPYRHLWESMDGDNKVQRGEAWLVDMVKNL
jgi:ribosomal protein S18 acetylase RimI-like enzyme